MTLALVQSRIPLREDCRYGPILIILLGNMFTGQAKQHEICRVVDARSRYVLSGSNHYWPTYVFLPRTERDVFGNSGTMTDIYNIAEVASASNWEALMFVDELSWRQHNKLITNHEDPTLSATVVNLKCLPSEDGTPLRSTFYMRRLPLVMALEETYLSEPQAPKDWSRVNNQTAGSHLFQLHLRTGFYLHSPWEPIFSSEDITGLQDRALRASPALPPELKSQITNYIHPDEPSCLQELIDTSLTNDTNIELIQPLVFLTDDELSAVHRAVQNELDSHAFRMGRWKQKSFANRREVSRIIRHFQKKVYSIIFVLNRPSDAGGLQLALYNSPSPSFEQCKFGVLHKMPLTSFKEEYDGTSLYARKHCLELQSHKNKEAYIDPLGTFPPGLPSWYKILPFTEISRERHRGYSEPGSMRHDKYLVFYLTKHLADHEKQRIQMTVEDENGSGTEFDYIPWENDVDGGPEDMLRLFKMVESAAAMGYTSESDRVLVFIDRESAKDGNVIVCTRDLVLGYGDSGILYGRMGQQVDSCLINVPGNMDIEDWVEDTEFFRDHDYSGPLTEEEEEEEEELVDA